MEMMSMPSRSAQGSGTCTASRTVIAPHLRGSPEQAVVLSAVAIPVLAYSCAMILAIHCTLLALS